MRRLAIIFVLALAASCHATTYYVATTGSDANPGSLAAPWLTLGHAATIAAASDVVTVEDGTYVFTQLNLNSSGATFIGQNKWGAVLEASNGDTTTPFINLAANSLTFENFEIIGQPGIAEGVKCNGTTQTNCVIQGNKVHGFGVQDTCQSGAAVELGSGVTTGAQILGNYIYNVGPTRTSGSRCNQYHGIYIGGGTAPTVQNNIVFEVWQGYALHVNSSASVINGVFTNNTIFNSGDNTGGGTSSPSGGPMVLDCHATCSGNKFNNNIFYSTQGVGPNCFREVQESGATISGNTFSNNLLNSCGTNLFVGGDADVNTVTGNPTFVNYTGDQSGDYHLSTTGSHTITATASDGTSGSSVVTVSNAAPIVGFDLKPMAEKNMIEFKECERALVETNFFELAYGSAANGGGQGGPVLLAQSINQNNQTLDGNGVNVGYGPEKCENLTVRTNESQHSGEGLAAVALGQALGVHNFSIHDNVLDDANYQRWGNGFLKIMTAAQLGGTGSTTVLSWTSSGKPLADFIGITHNTEVGNVTNLFSINNNLAQFKLNAFTWQDNFFASPGAATFVNANGEASDCDTAAGTGANNSEARAMTNCFATYLFNHNALIGSTASPSVFLSPAITQPTGAGVGFVNYNGANGGDYRLCTGVNLPAAPCAAASSYIAGGANQASDGTNLGANVSAVNAAVAAAKAGVRTP